MKHTTLPAALLILLAVSCSHGDRLVKVADGAWARNSVNTTVFRNQSLVTHGDRQYTAFYNADGQMVLGARRLGSAEWELHVTQYGGNVTDAHNVISLGVDGDGVLHVAWDHHGHPLHYARAVEAGSLELGEMMPMAGTEEGKVTYPEFCSLPDGDLIFAYRDGSSGNGNMVLNRFDNENDTWSRVQSSLIDGERERNAYWQMCADSEGGLHVSWVWRETYNVETNHDLCYAYSPDGGVSWFRSDRKSEYALPITAGNAEYVCLIPQNSELINQTSMACDDATRPYIASYWRDAESEVPQYRLVYFDGREWRQQQLGLRKTPFSLSGAGSKKIPIARPRLAVRTAGDDKVEVRYIFRDEERGSRVSLAECDNLAAGEWRVRDLTDFSVESWEPSYDTKLWAERGMLHIFVQHTGQGDGESLEEVEPQPVYVMEVR